MGLKANRDYIRDPPMRYDSPGQRQKSIAQKLPLWGPNIDREFVGFSKKFVEDWSSIVRLASYLSIMASAVAD